MILSKHSRIVNLNPSFPIPSCPEKAITFSQKIAYLLSESHHSLSDADNILESLTYDLPKVLDLAFREENPEALLDFHKALYSIYEINFSHPLSIICLHQNSPWLLSIRNELETAWLSYEFAGIKQYLPVEEVLDSQLLCSWFIEQAREKSDTDSYILEFLKNEATLEDFSYFILSDAPLNYRFFDALALALIYFSENVKSEVSRNMWDECGNGLIGKSHTQQFTSMLSEIGLVQPHFPIWKDWRPYAGYNLHLCFSLSRRYYFRSIGSLAMSELFDPDRNRYVVGGLERLYPNAKVKCEYFYNHIEADEEHGLLWLKNIVLPIIEAQPEAGIELAIGASLRMVAMRRYNQYLASGFGLSI